MKRVLNRVGKQMRFSSRPDHPRDGTKESIQERDLTVWRLRERHVRGGARIAIQPLITNVADNADDLPWNAFLELRARPAADQKPIVERVAVRPESPSHGLIDEDDGR